MNVDFLSTTPDDKDLTIAADGGLKNLEKFKIVPNLIIGDFDSLKYIPEGENVFVHPKKKDKTDTLLAVDAAMEKGYNNFVIYGCLGGRLDQTLASIQTASYIAEKGGNATFIDGETCLTVIKNETCFFSDKCQGTISVFAVSESNVKATLKNLLYETNEAKVTPDYPIGVSNEFIGKRAEITVKGGKLCIIWNGSSDDCLK